MSTDSGSIDSDQDFYVPSYKIQVGDQALPGDVIRDVISISYSDGLEQVDSFELVINNWDTDKLVFKYSDRPLFDPGKQVALWMGYLGKEKSGRERMRLMLTGEITSLRPSFPSGGLPALTIRGSSGAPARSKLHVESSDEARREPIPLKYGHSLIEFQTDLSVADQASHPVHSQEEAHAPAREIREQIARRIMKGSGSTIGMPDLRAGRMILVEGLGERFSGRYFVTSTTHKIDDSGYTTRFECRREEIQEADRG